MVEIGLASVPRYQQALLLYAPKPDGIVVGDVRPVPTLPVRSNIHRRDDVEPLRWPGPRPFLQMKPQKRLAELRIFVELLEGLKKKRLQEAFGAARVEDPGKSKAVHIPTPLGSVKIERTPSNDSYYGDALRITVFHNVSNSVSLGVSHAVNLKTGELTGYSKYHFGFLFLPESGLYNATSTDEGFQSEDGHILRGTAMIAGLCGFLPQNLRLYGKKNAASKLVGMNGNERMSNHNGVYFDAIELGSTSTETNLKDGSDEFLIKGLEVILTSPNNSLMTGERRAWDMLSNPALMEFVRKK